MPDQIYFTVFLLLISPFVGSFLTVLIDRLPRGESIVWPGSACPRCNTRLGILDLMPILSFSLGRGRCRHCAKPIPPWHLYVEITAIGVAFLAVARGGSAFDLAATAVFLWLLLALAVTDLIWFRLPDTLTAALFATALAMAHADIWMAIVSAAIGCGSFLAIRLAYRSIRGREGLGMGDVKLMAGIGAVTGLHDLPLMVLLAALATLIAALATTAFHSAPLHRNLSGTRPLPFGAALCGAAAVILLIRDLPL